MTALRSALAHARPQVFTSSLRNGRVKTLPQIEHGPVRLAADAARRASQRGAVSFAARINATCDAGGFGLQAQEQARCLLDVRIVNRLPQVGHTRSSRGAGTMGTRGRKYATQHAFEHVLASLAAVCFLARNIFLQNRQARVRRSRASSIRRSALGCIGGGGAHRFVQCHSCAWQRNTRNRRPHPRHLRSIVAADGRFGRQARSRQRTPAARSHLESVWALIPSAAVISFDRLPAR